MWSQRGPKCARRIQGLVKKEGSRISAKEGLSGSRGTAHARGNPGIGCVKCGSGAGSHSSPSRWRLRGQKYRLQKGE
ncbi:hypothetical protein N7495_009928 [Penicillium taxi]|uniref:uncharacterized protein n=1 Tax=Penicillium taxi TaxID=168475 RepID=UPI0025452BEC|nr:uncharacterized protein N7495_009928 [Penicillium taxi]KAJ5885418.1 hypothetical protein N7495_009928 [Penicillium taxi]